MLGALSNLREVRTLASAAGHWRRSKSMRWPDSLGLGVDRGSPMARSLGVVRQIGETRVHDPDAPHLSSSSKSRRTQRSATQHVHHEPKGPFPRIQPTNPWVPAENTSVRLNPRETRPRTREQAIRCKVDNPRPNSLFVWGIPKRTVWFSNGDSMGQLQWVLSSSVCHRQPARSPSRAPSPERSLVLKHVVDIHRCIP